MNIFTIIVTYNGIKFIDKCFGSLRESDIPVHVIAIDNASTDGTVEKIRNDYPEVELVVNKKNIGFGRANNLGLFRALEDKADYVLLLNQDAWIEPDMLEGLIKIQQKQPDYGILSPLHFDIEDHTKIDRNCAYSFSNEMISDAVAGRTLKEVYHVSGIHAAIWLISRECLEDVGGFDPLFYYRQEDVDYMIRVRNKEYKFGIVPSVKAYHRGGMVRAEKPNSREKLIFALGEKLFLFKLHLSKSFIKIYTIVLIECISEIVKNLLMLKLKSLIIYLEIMFIITWKIPKIVLSRVKTKQNQCALLKACH